jgi:REP-associated tyrosine transposase
VQAADAVYHVNSRGVEKRDIFTSTRCYLSFLSILELTVSRFEWICHSYVAMRNHFHLVVETPLANISPGMQFLKSEYATWFNVEHGREGTLYERRFHDVIADSESHVLELCRYVVLNPVRSGFKPHPSDWIWSSYNATVGLVAKPAFLSIEPTIALFGGGALGVARFVEFVEEGMILSRRDLSLSDLSGSDPDAARMDMAVVDGVRRRAA